MQYLLHFVCIENLFMVRKEKTFISKMALNQPSHLSHALLSVTVDTKIIANKKKDKITISR